MRVPYIASANAATFTPGFEQGNWQLRGIVSYTDAFGAQASLTSATTAAVLVGTGLRA